MYWNPKLKGLFNFLSRLTLTWDVLKWINPKDSDAMNLWLTLTWDVLK